MRRLPLLARWLLRVTPVARDARGDIESDLHELFAARRQDRGALHAHWRLYHDLASLWSPRTPLAVLREAGADVRYAARLFARQPGILLLTVAGLSVGLGIATAAFSIMNAAVLRGEGVTAPHRAPGILRTTDRSVSTAWPYDEFLHLRAGSTRMQVEAVLSDAARVRTASAEDETPLANVGFVSEGFFAATGGRMLRGRPLQAGDEQHRGPLPVVVSHTFWSTRLNGDPGAIGRPIWIGRATGTIVGIAERRFSVPHQRLLWIPLTAYPAVYHAAPVKDRLRLTVEVFGRLDADVSMPEAEAQLSGVASGLARPAAPADSAIRVRLDPGRGLGRVASSDLLAVAASVAAIIALVLLLACANVASVLIGVAITREREMGVRAALGASRRRIVRQLVTESLALGTLAAAIGLLIAYWAIPVIGTMTDAPAGIDLAPDLNVYLFLGAITLLTGVGAGLAPAWHGRGADLLTPLKGDGARDHRLAPRRLRSALVVVQAAASILLIVMAGFFVRASFRAAAIDVGFNADGLYAISPGLANTAAEGAPRTDSPARAMAEVQAVPGIAAVTLAEFPPFGGATKSSVTGDGPTQTITYFNRTHAEYFAVLGLRIVAGRTFTAGEVSSKAPVALVSQALARTFFPDRSPLGELLPERIKIPEIPAAARPVIVGVVADAITARLHESSPFAVYQPLDPGSEKFGRLIVRVTPGAGGIQLARQRLRTLDPQATVQIVSIAETVREEAAQPRMLATLTATIGTIAILLCVIGLYGLTASVVGQRSREMGIRIAMGATRRDLLRLLMWDSLRPVAFGLAAGAGGALLVSRAAASFTFFGTSPRDPLAFAAAIVILLAAAMFAVLTPTRRAASVDAAVVLRRS